MSCNWLYLHLILNYADLNFLFILVNLIAEIVSSSFKLLYKQRILQGHALTIKAYLLNNIKIAMNPALIPGTLKIIGCNLRLYF